MAEKLGKDIAFSMCNQIVNIILPLISAPIVSRAIGAEGVGTQAVIAADATYFHMFALLGLQNYGNRTIALQKSKDAEDQVFWEILAMQGICGLVAIAAYFLLFVGVNTGPDRLYYLLYSPYVIAAALDVNWYFYGKAEFKYITLRNLAVRVLSFLAIVLFVKNSNHVGRYIFIIGVSQFISVSLLWPKILRTVSFRKIKRANVMRHVKPNLILFVPVLAMSVYRVMDKTMLGVISGNRQAGLYENADRILSIALTVFTAIGTVMLPHSTKLIARGEQNKFLKLMRDAMQIQLGIAICMSVGILMVADKAVPIYFGADFAEAAPVLKLLAIVPILATWKSVIRTQFLIPAQKDKAYAVSLICGACVNVVLNLVFIPMYGACGAAIGTIGAELAGLLLQTLPYYKEFPIRKMLMDTVPFWGAAGIMAVVLRQIETYVTSFVSLVFAIAIAGSVFVVTALIILRLLSKERYEVLIGYVRKHREGKPDEQP